MQKRVPSVSPPRQGRGQANHDHHGDAHVKQVAVMELVSPLRPGEEKKPKRNHQHDTEILDSAKTDTEQSLSAV